MAMIWSLLLPLELIFAADFCHNERKQKLLLFMNRLEANIEKLWVNVIIDNYGKIWRTIK